MPSKISGYSPTCYLSTFMANYANWFLAKFNSLVNTVGLSPKRSQIRIGIGFWLAIFKNSFDNHIVKVFISTTNQILEAKGIVSQ
jgi:hypothetical protein